MNHTLYNAVAALTWHCDGARSRDAQGFSKADAAWGALLSRGSEAGWHPSWPRAAWEMLRKYRKQLAGYGIVYEAIPEPPQSGAPFERLPVFRSVTVSNGGLRFHFPYSPQIGVKLRDAGCKWDMMGKVWWVLPSPENVQAILDVARQFEFAVSPEALALLNSPPAGRPTSEKKASPAMPREIVQASPGLYKIMFEYDSRLVAEVKALPGRRYHAGDERFWTAPLSAELASFAYANLFIGAEPIAVALAERDCLHDLNRAESKADSAEVDTSGLGGELRPFQRVGVRYALRNERVFIADEMGLGKTVQALAAVHAAKAFPALIVCPASLKHNWKRESEKWLPGREVVVLNGQKRGGSLSGPPFGGGGEVVVVNYDLLKRWADELMTRQFKAVIFDESHYLKNSKALRTQRARALAKGVKYRFCLTGTPVLNRPVELLSQLALIDRLEEMGGFWSFAKRYCNAYRSKFGWDLSGAANLEELNRLLRERCFIRRNKADVLTELPAKQRSVLPVEISNRKDYETASSDLLFYLGERAANDEAFLQEIAHLSPQKRSQAKWARASTAQYKAEAAEALVRVETLKQVAAQGKLEAVTEWAESFLESDQKLVLFASHIAIQKALIERFPGCASILGEYDSQLRQDNVDRFQNDPRCRLIVCSLQAAAEGITLTAASNVAFVELGWNPGRMSQAEDRVHRIGQRDNVTCYYLLAKDTIDEEIYGLIERKREVVDALTEGDDPTDANKGILSELLARLREKKG